MRQLKITKQVTNRETASLDKYLQEIGKVDLKAGHNHLVSLLYPRKRHASFEKVAEY